MHLKHFAWANNKINITNRFSTPENPQIPIFSQIGPVDRPKQPPRDSNHHPSPPATHVGGALVDFFPISLFFPKSGGKWVGPNRLEPYFSGKGFRPLRFRWDGSQLSPSTPQGGSPRGGPPKIPQNTKMIRFWQKSVSPLNRAWRKTYDHFRTDAFMIHVSRFR